MLLDFNDKFLLLSIKTYHKFWAKYHYDIYDLVYWGKEGDGIYYVNRKKKIRVLIHFDYSIWNEEEDGYFFEIYFWRRTFIPTFGKDAFSLPEIMKQFDEYSNFTPYITEDNMEEKIKLYLDFMQKYLLPVIKGEIWIDKLLEKLSK